MRRHLPMIVFSLILILTSCKEDGPGENPPKPCRLILTFSHQVDGELFEVDTLKYLNTAGNHYLVSEIQYFISDVSLHSSGLNIVVIGQEPQIHYVDTDIPESLIWETPDFVPAGVYDSITFTFGVPEAKNITGRFPNPPESNMFWPDVLGGGYHHMKLNGKWLDTLQLLSAYHLHLGTGQVYDEQGQITGFVPNDFHVTLPGSNFILNSDDTLVIPVIMNIESWFDTPNIYDFNYWGGGIMQNQDAMQAVKENGKDVFTLGDIHKKGTGE